MSRSRIRLLVAVIVAAVLAGGWWLARPVGLDGDGTRAHAPGRVAVEAGAVTTGAVADVRSFTGSVEAGNAFTVAPKIGGLVERVHVDIGDPVRRGQVVVELDDDEATQSLAEAEAELAVARAEREQARADTSLARRELERTRTLAQRELASQSELDTASARAEAQQAAVAVATARVSQREAALARARVQLGYTSVRADWPGEDAQRVVGERLINAGDTVAANTPLLTILDLTPVIIAFSAPESDYAHLSRGQTVRITADAFPQREFAGRIARIAPRFAEDSRQARVEVTADNDDGALKPGMFATARVTVDSDDNATLVPAEAVVRRAEGAGVYLIVEDEPSTVRFVPIRIGIEGEDRIQVLEPELSGQVVTLGQQMLEDGAPVVISELPAS